ncbi:DNA binding domain-containing protein, excisionase family [Fontibacillus panacisegetis]|uniref:DNA binding domain-containing protein, excisionase family n=1 Tax=Fontibacillus panacisegetis TaxID=670482 RepID=A0A1G7HW89_9BACL|nr:helix-turn-helix domain-containing protein [Fontibacillus panacisegetis]SDF04623.1 DNA binding domain-containing protein, excisionase family [Fontibacillus panacisegetis]
MSLSEKNLLTVKEARSELFDNAISEYKLYEMLRQGELPAVKVGAKYLLRRSSIIEWMAAQEQSALAGK